MFGKSEAVQTLRSRMVRVASASVPVLIEGESGTGKAVWRVASRGGIIIGRATSANWRT